MLDRLEGATTNRILKPQKRVPVFILVIESLNRHVAAPRLLAGLLWRGQFWTSGNPKTFPSNSNMNLNTSMGAVLCDSFR